jgi:hypothetical protein
MEFTKALKRSFAANDKEVLLKGKGSRTGQKADRAVDSAVVIIVRKTHRRRL